MGLCEIKDNVKDALYAQTIQGLQNTEAIKAQAQAFQIVQVNLTIWVLVSVLVVLVVSVVSVVV